MTTRFTSSLTRALQTRSRHPATIFQDRTRSWGEVGARVKRLAGGLRARGVADGDRVAILALNCDNYLEAFYGIAWAGAISVPLNTRWAFAEIVFALNDCGATLLLVDEHFADQAEALAGASGVRAVVYIGDGDAPPGMEGYEPLLARSEPAPDRCGAGDDPCSICYTGGTTGRSKGVILTNANLVYAVVNWIASLHFDEDTVFMHSAGFFHLAGSIPLFALTMAGGTHVCLPKFDPGLGMEVIERHRVTYCLFVPTMINMILNHPKVDAHDLSSVKIIEYGASSMPDAVLTAALERLPGCIFIQGYGLTESTALSLSMPWKYHFPTPGTDSKRRGTGRVAYGMEVKIVGPDGDELPLGTHGEIALRGPQVMAGYWNQPDLTAAALRDGWLVTGDGGYMDEDGFIFLTDRVKDMIVSGGENVYSREVENVLQSHPAIRDCAVIGIPSAEWVESVHAVVVFRSGRGATLEEIREHCRGQLAGYKCPRSMEVRDALPLSAAGKILKSTLREEIARRVPGP